MYELRKEITALYFVVTVNHLLSAPPRPPSNKPSLFRGRKLISHALFFSPPPPLYCYYSLANDRI